MDLCETLNLAGRNAGGDALHCAVRGFVDCRSLLEYISYHTHVLRLAYGLPYLHPYCTVGLPTAACEAEGKLAQAAERNPQGEDTVGQAFRRQNFGQIAKA